ncbi:MAG TPA: hypothetical protein ENH60_07350 [Pricia sp.]|nr:hypothetical protein [Pricia sp.]
MEILASYDGSREPFTRSHMGIEDGRLVIDNDTVGSYLERLSIGFEYRCTCGHKTQIRRSQPEFTCPECGKCSQFDHESSHCMQGLLNDDS